MTLRATRFTAVAGVLAVSLGAATASAAQPAAPPPAASTSTSTTQVPADASVIIVNNTTTAAPTASASAPVAVASAPVAVAPVPVVAPAPTVVVTATDVPPPPIPPVNPRQDAINAKRSEKGSAMGLAIGGWAMFGSTYLVSALIGTVALDTSSAPNMRRFGNWMTVPVAGPFGAAFNTETATGTLFTTTLGVAQAAGITMALIGTVRHRRAKRDLRLMAMPTRTGGQVGVSMRF